MELRFTKMNGAGNDFVMVDNRDGALALSRDQIAALCDRHRGVGADGLLAVEPTTLSGALWRMRYYNADGGEAEMCGNGARCFARFVQRLEGGRGAFAFQTAAGLLRANFEGALVRIAMSEPSDLSLRESLSLGGGNQEVHFINTGVPHTVLVVKDIQSVPVAVLGSEIRHHARFAPRGTNVNFIQVLDGKALRIRTYERGVEAETLACGTGVTASA
ncbi:MAG: diaminopimelate epimerase, partial [Phycisphaerales bacterium]